MRIQLIVCRAYSSVPSPLPVRKGLSWYLTSLLAYPTSQIEATLYAVQYPGDTSVRHCTAYWLWYWCSSATQHNKNLGLNFILNIHIQASGQGNQNKHMNIYFKYSVGKMFCFLFLQFNSNLALMLMICTNNVYLFTLFSSFLNNVWSFKVMLRFFSIEIDKWLLEQIKEKYCDLWQLNSNPVESQASQTSQLTKNGSK